MAEANGGAVKRNGGKRRSERSGTKARHGFESDEALKYAGICHSHGDGGDCADSRTFVSLTPTLFISYLLLFLMLHKKM